MSNLTQFGLTISDWYMNINLPPWAPPVWMYGVAWGIIYPLMTASFGFVFWKTFIRREWPRYIGVVFAVNLVFNALYALGTYAVFADAQMLSDINRYYWPAFAVIAVVLATVPLLIALTWGRAKWVALAQLPYLVWLAVATPLQLVINVTN